MIFSVCKLFIDNVEDRYLKCNDELRIAMLKILTKHYLGAGEGVL